eukprot:CAMPEP_0206159000 /NCGR_PEP_ID=MMETSP1474-20131121/5376_1 /ASSEMBLY_ACC=CAM_ASM_001110 /TAXON_ID=97495 /ORGANISM="Imantonia sp., Strain RCC918" /LENGTH=242 /DNA_ID=CAMNT_0053559403 /DNA_START=59 /DNA_END=787 /DNA_ORIENTATION=+
MAVQQQILRGRRQRDRESFDGEQQRKRSRPVPVPLLAEGLQLPLLPARTTSPALAANPAGSDACWDWRPSAASAASTRPEAAVSTEPAASGEKKAEGPTSRHMSSYAGCALVKSRPFFRLTEPAAASASTKPAAASASTKPAAAATGVQPKGGGDRAHSATCNVLSGGNNAESLPSRSWGDHGEIMGRSRESLPSRHMSSSAGCTCIMNRPFRPIADAIRAAYAVCMPARAQANSSPNTLGR